MMNTLILLFIVSQMGLVFNLPHYKKSDEVKLQHETTLEHAENHPTKALPQTTQTGRKKKGFTIPLTFLQQHIHTVPVQYNHVILHQNRTSQTQQLIPVYTYLPVHHNYLVPVQDLQVIPLKRELRRQGGHYTPENRGEIEEVNRFRSFYGGYGTSLFFGGQGAGHGFYIYG